MRVGVRVGVILSGGIGSRVIIHRVGTQPWSVRPSTTHSTCAHTP